MTKLCHIQKMTCLCYIKRKFNTGIGVQFISGHPIYLSNSEVPSYRIKNKTLYRSPMTARKNHSGRTKNLQGRLSGFSAYGKNCNPHHGNQYVGFPSSWEHVVFRREKSRPSRDPTTHILIFHYQSNWPKQQRKTPEFVRFSQRSEKWNSFWEIRFVSCGGPRSSFVDLSARIMHHARYECIFMLCMLVYLHLRVYVHRNCSTAIHYFLIIKKCLIS